jgi:hypothetical protein
MDHINRSQLSEHLLCARHSLNPVTFNPDHTCLSEGNITYPAYAANEGRFQDPNLGCADLSQCPWGLGRFPCASAVVPCSRLLPEETVNVHDEGIH